LPRLVPTDLDRLAGAWSGASRFAAVYLASLVLPVVVCATMMWQWPLVRAALAPMALILAWSLYQQADGVHLLAPALPFAVLLGQEGYTWLVNRMVQAGVGLRRVPVVMGLLPLLLAAGYVGRSFEDYARMSAARAPAGDAALASGT